MSSVKYEKHLKQRDDRIYKLYLVSHLWTLMTLVTFIEKIRVSIPRFRFDHDKRGERMAVSICTLLLAFLANVYSNSSGQNSAGSPVLRYV